MNKKPRVAYVATVFRHLETFHKPYMKLLQDKGYEVHAFGAFDKSETELKDLNITCHNVPFSRSPISFKNILALFIQFKEYKKYEFKMIHFHTPVASFVGRVAAKFAKVPVIIYTAHGFHFYKGAPLINWVIYYPLEKLAAKWTDAVITINDEDKHMASKLNNKWEVYKIDGIGVENSHSEFFNTALKEKVRKSLGLKNEDFLISYVAEINKNKNHIQMIKAIKMLTDQGIDVYCAFIGIGDYLEEIKKEVNLLKLEKYIIFLGYRKDAVQLIYSSDILALLSLREGLPKAILEAMILSKPIVATNVRGNRDLVNNGINGYLVSVGDASKTAEAVKQLINNKEKVKSMGNNSYQRSNSYLEENVIKKIEQIYNENLDYI